MPNKPDYSNWVAQATEAELKRILRAARVYLDMRVGFISQFTNTKRVFRYVDGLDESIPVEVGGSDEVEESYCHWLAKGMLPNIITNSADYPITASLAVTKTLGIGAYIGTTIRLRDGEVYGTFCCFSPDPEPSLAKRDLAILETFAELAGDIIQKIVDTEQLQREVQDTLQRLTPRERSVLESLSDGASNKLVAQRLGLSPRTVEMYRGKIFTKLGVENLPQALLLVWRSREPASGNLSLPSD